MADIARVRQVMNYFGGYHNIYSPANSQNGVAVQPNQREHHPPVYGASGLNYGMSVKGGNRPLPQEFGAAGHQPHQQWQANPTHRGDYWFDAQ